MEEKKKGDMAAKTPEKSGKPKKETGLHLYHFSTVMGMALALLCLCLLYMTKDVTESYEGVVGTTEQYVHWSQNALNVHESSEYLTEQARLFSQTAQRQYMENYFIETFITQRRTRVLEEIHAYYDADKEILDELELAIEESKKLAEREYYAIKLVCMGAELPAQYIPPEIQETALETGDTALSPQEQWEKGESLLYDAEYQQAKDSIYSHVNNFVSTILEESGVRRENSVKHFRNAIQTQRIFVVLLVLLGVTILLVIRRMISKPLLRFIKRIRERAMLDIVGVEELRVLAREYNALYAVLAAETTQFQYRPENDPLTKVMHQETYREIAEALQENEEPMALVIFCMDDFAALVAKYDDYTVDWMIKKAAALLAQQAELKDHVARIDRAEFAAIFMNETQECRADLEELFQKINAEALHPDDSLPAFSLSAGVAFSEEGWQKMLSGKAREALLQAHQRGMAQIAFYEE